MLLHVRCVGARAAETESYMEMVSLAADRSIDKRSAVCARVGVCVPSDSLRTSLLSSRRREYVNSCDRSGAQEPNDDVLSATFSKWTDCSARENEKRDETRSKLYRVEGVFAANVH